MRERAGAALWAAMYFAPPWSNTQASLHALITPVFCPWCALQGKPVQCSSGVNCGASPLSAGHAQGSACTRPSQRAGRPLPCASSIPYILRSAARQVSATAHCARLASICHGDCHAYVTLLAKGGIVTTSQLPQARARRQPGLTKSGCAAGGSADPACALDPPPTPAVKRSA